VIHLALDGYSLRLKNRSRASRASSVFPAGLDDGGVLVEERRLASRKGLLEASLAVDFAIWPVVDVPQRRLELLGAFNAAKALCMPIGLARSLPLRLENLTTPLKSSFLSEASVTFPLHLRQVSGSPSTPLILATSTFCAGLKVSAESASVQSPHPAPKQAILFPHVAFIFSFLTGSIINA